MSNHVHLIVVPQRDDSLAHLIRRVHSTYAQDFNRRRSRDGHVWRSRFYSCALGPGHLAAALLYVDLNPVRAGMTGEATAWEWSSAVAHAGGRDETRLLARQRLAELGGCENWSARLKRRQAESTEQRLRQATQTGTPFADAKFRHELERRYGRDLEWKPRGRSPKPTALSAADGGL